MALIDLAEASGSDPVERGFSLELRHGPQGFTMALAGVLDGASAPQLRSAIDELGAGRCDGDVRLDLAGVEFLDSAGVGCLFRLHRRVADHGGLIIATGATPPVRRVLHATGLTRVVAVLD